MLALLAAGALFEPLPSQGGGEQVPMVGRDGPDVDACAGVGRVSGLNLSFDNYLPVHERPADRAREKDRLSPRTLVWLCDAQGEWQGIVYASGDFQELGDCRVSVAVAEPRPYDGPCQTGWVTAKNLQLVTG